MNPYTWGAAEVLHTAVVDLGIGYFVVAFTVFVSIVALGLHVRLPGVRR